MLTRLSIRDFVIVDHTELDFQPGFTVLSGETGAGKSILLDALGLLLGDKGDASVVRQGASRAELEAEFAVAAVPGLADWLEDYGFAGGDDHLLLRRLIDSSGRSRCFINGAQATAGQLKDLGEQLVDIHGQHAHQSLLRPDLQRNLLDACAGCTGDVRQLRELYASWQSARERLLHWQEASAEMQAQREAWQWQQEELERLAPEAGEWESLNQEHQRLSHGVELIQGAERASALLQEDDASAASLLRAALAQLDELRSIDAGLQSCWETVSSAVEQVQDASRELRHYAGRVEVDPERLAELDARLSDWMKLARKYRLQPEELPGHWQDVQQKLAELDAGSDGSALQAAAEAAEQAWRSLASKVSALRQQAASRLSEQVTQQLAELAMGNHRFAVQLQALDKPVAAGLEAVEFQVSPHASMPLRSLAKTASGGELSRISLAIQVVTAQVAAVPTLIFDEVDVGIGGRVAEIVGRKLRGLGQNYQVLCVTHLPQVAACGHQHWQVAKSTAGHGVSSRISVLDAGERVEEIARMLGGVELTETTRHHARELLELAASQG